MDLGGRAPVGADALERELAALLRGSHCAGGGCRHEAEQDAPGAHASSPTPWSARGRHVGGRRLGLRAPSPRHAR